MTNRPLKRSVKIVLKSRDRSDPYPIFEAVEKAFRPGTVEIHVEADGPGHPAVPDEQLETEARELVAEELDRRDREVASSPSGPVTSPATTPAAEVPVPKRGSLMATLKNYVARGWRFAVKISPDAERLAKLAKSIEDVVN